MKSNISKREENLIDKTKRVYKERGIFGVFRASLIKLSKISFETNSAIWFKRDLSQPIEEFQAKIPLVFVSNRPEEMIAWLRSFGQEWLVDPKEIRTGFEEKHHFLYVHKKDGEVVGGSKVGYGKVYIVDFGKIINFPEGIAFWYDTYVSPVNRGLGIATYLISSSLFFLKQKDFKKVMCHIPKWNKASIKAFKRCGFKEMKYVRFFRLFSFKFTVPGLNNLIK